MCTASRGVPRVTASVRNALRTLCVCTKNIMTYDRRLVARVSAGGVEVAWQLTLHEGQAAPGMRTAATIAHQ